MTQFFYKIIVYVITYITMKHFITQQIHRHIKYNLICSFMQKHITCIYNKPK